MAGLSGNKKKITQDPVARSQAKPKQQKIFVPKVMRFSIRIAWGCRVVFCIIELFLDFYLTQVLGYDSIENDRLLILQQVAFKMFEGLLKGDGEPASSLIPPRKNEFFVSHTTIERAHSAVEPVKPASKRKNRSELHGPCGHCGAAESPQWRKGPKCKPVLCNACGTRFLRTKSLGKQTRGSKAAKEIGSCPDHEDFAEQHHCSPIAASPQHDVAQAELSMSDETFEETADEPIPFPNPEPSLTETLQRIAQRARTASRSKAAFSKEAREHGDTVTSGACSAAAHPQPEVRCEETNSHAEWAFHMEGQTSSTHWPEAMSSGSRQTQAGIAQPDWNQLPVGPGLLPLLTMLQQGGMLGVPSQFQTLFLPQASLASLNQPGSASVHLPSPADTRKRIDDSHYRLRLLMAHMQASKH